MVRTSSLVKILEGKPTDKIANGLAAYYDTLFGPIRDQVESLLEIGIDRGGSIKGWLEFFPNALIYAVDNRMEAVRSIEGHYNIVALYGNAADREFLERAFQASQFDIVIDDGSHINREVIAAFEVLWPKVQSGGYYIVEDIQVPYRNRDYPTIPVFFLNYATENNLKEAEFRHNVLYLRKP